MRMDFTLECRPDSRSIVPMVMTSKADAAAVDEAIFPGTGTPAEGPKMRSCSPGTVQIVAAADEELGGSLIGPLCSAYEASLRACEVEVGEVGYFYVESHALGMGPCEHAGDSNPPSTQGSGLTTSPQQEQWGTPSPKRDREEDGEDLPTQSLPGFKRQRYQDLIIPDMFDEACSSSVFNVEVEAMSGDSLSPTRQLGSETGPAFHEEYQELDDAALELQMLCDDFEFEMPDGAQLCSPSCSEEGEDGDTISSGSARKSRRDKIKKTMRLLRNIIPGGGCYDTAVILDEAIEYVKVLQLQVQLLEAKRRMEKVGRQQI